MLANGLSGLSLRPLAKALGTSPRMLLYDFGSKERLVEEILAEVRRRGAALLAEAPFEIGMQPVEGLAAVWEWASAEERAPFMRLFFQVFVDAMTHPELYAEGARPMIGDWVAFLGASGVDPALATLYVAVIRGLLLDRLTTADPTHADAALARFTELLER